MKLGLFAAAIFIIAVTAIIVPVTTEEVYAQARQLYLTNPQFVVVVAV